MTELRADCSACAALCCMAFAFDAGEDFAIDKPAGAGCPKLAGFACSIHADRVAQGFHGCIGFDCQGAGQRVTQEVFPGVDWRDSPGMVRPMIDAFRAMRAVHGLLDLVRLSGRLPLSEAEAGERAALMTALEADWDAKALAAFEGGALERRSAAFLTGLRDRAETMRPA